MFVWFSVCWMSICFLNLIFLFSIIKINMVNDIMLRLFIWINSIIMIWLMMVKWVFVFMMVKLVIVIVEVDVKRVFIYWIGLVVEIGIINRRVFIIIFLLKMEISSWGGVSLMICFFIS